MDRSIFTEWSNWGWTRASYYKENTSLIYFRKELELEQDVRSAVLKISANSRYRIFVNGVYIAQDNYKGDNKGWYYDEVEVKQVLHQGANVVAAIVFRYSQVSEKVNNSVWKTEMPGVYLEGNIVFQDGKELTFGEDESWRNFHKDKVDVLKTDPRFDSIGISEATEGENSILVWKKMGFKKSMEKLILRLRWLKG